MISLRCAKCGVTIRVDDGFAGGVCRCSRCGTIQTVPLPGAITTADQAAGKAIYERSTRADGTDSDLAQLGQVVTSSGLPAVPVGRRRPKDPTVDQDVAVRPPDRPAWPIVLSVIAAALVLGGVGVGLWLGSAPPAVASSTGAEPEADAQSSPAAALPTGPRFGRTPLTELSPVLYLVDGDAATRIVRPAIRLMILQSIGSLRAPRAFQIRGVAPVGHAFDAHPATGVAPASKQLIDEAGEWLETSATPPADVGAADLAGAIESALGLKPGEIVLITASPARLDDAFAARVARVLRRSPEVRLHVLAVGTDRQVESLKRLSDLSRGQLTLVADRQALTDLARQ